MRRVWLLIPVLILVLSQLLILNVSGEEVSLWNIKLEVIIVKRENNEFLPFNNKIIEINVDREQFTIKTDEKGSLVIYMARNTTSDYLLRRFRVYSISFPELVFLEKIEGDVPYYSRSWVIERMESNKTYYRIRTLLVPRVLKIDQKEHICSYLLKVQIASGKVYNLFYLNPFTLKKNVYIYNYNWIPVLHTNKVCIPKDASIITFSARFDAKFYSAHGLIYRRYRITCSTPLSNVLYNGTIDIIPTITFKLHSIVIREAEEVKGKLKCFNLWSADLEKQFRTLMSILNSSRNHCLERKYILSGYENRVALRILRGLQEAGKLVNIIGNYFITPFLLLAIAFFSYFTARIISERRWYLVAVLLFITTTLIFMKANSYFSLYLTTIVTPLFAEPPEMHIFRIGLLTFLIALFLALLHPKVSSRLNVLELTIRNICNRKRRFALALIVVSLVSSATVTHLQAQCKRVLVEKDIPYKSFVERGLTIKKASINYLYGEEIIPKKINLNYDEALWLLSFSSASSCFGTASLKLLVGEKEIGCKVSICNINYLIEFCNLTKALVHYNRSLLILNYGILISSSLAEKLNLKIGSKVRVLDTVFLIVGYFNRSVLRELIDIDGERIFEFATDIILPQKDDIIEAFQINKVSIVLLPNISTSLIDLVEYIGTVGLDVHKVFDPSAYGGRGAIRIIGQTYNINLVEQERVKNIMMLHEEYTILGAWESQIVLVIMGALIVFVTAMGSVYERRREAQIVSSLGASPSTIFAIFSLEGIVVGLVGGMLGFFIGFACSLITNIISKSLPLSTLGISEFFLLLIIGSITSVMGYIIPTVRATLLVVPSRRYLIKAASEEELSKVIKRTKRELVVQLPFKFLSNEKTLLDKFLSEEFIKIQTGRIYGIALTGFRKEVKRDVVSFVYNVSYKSPWHGLPLSLTITISLKGNNILTPIISIKSNFDLSLIRSDVKDLISSIREGLLYYVDWKREVNVT